MSFDKDTRNALAKMVTSCRRLLTTDVTDQLRGTFGLHPDGTVLPLEDLAHLTEDMKVSAQALRELLNHFAAGAAGTDAEKRKAAYDRMVLEIAFTNLNRLAALRLCEERELVLECVCKGMASDGFRLYESLAGGALGARFDTYRIFLESLYDELAVDLGVLFDRTTPQSAVFPTERCLEETLELVNDAKLTHLWAEDETIGWIYQYFNPPEERKAMRDASQAPRTSRELAVRNQLFTPRYVVEFLTDNTLGRLWYEMRQGQTRLLDDCRYLVRRVDERFLGPGEETPAVTDAEAELTQENQVREAVYITHRPKKDPRDIRILDPACGSGHFLLYCFDLLLVIYEEAWADESSPVSQATGNALRQDYLSLDDLRLALPGLVMQHNLHGIDIDARCAQIAALALWLRAQRAFRDCGVGLSSRPRIRKSNIVIAEPMPAEEDLLKDFTSRLEPQVLGQLVAVVFEKMKLAGVAGSLLRIDAELKDAVSQAKKQWASGPKHEQELFYFAGQREGEPATEQPMLFDVSGVSDAEFWSTAERLTINAIREFAQRRASGGVRRHLFCDDAVHGFAFISLCRQRYDVIIMNPPLTDLPAALQSVAKSAWPTAQTQLGAVFTIRASELTTEQGLLGTLINRPPLFIQGFEAFRRDVLLSSMSPIALLDIGDGDFEDVVVEVMALAARRSPIYADSAWLRTYRLIGSSDKAQLLSEAFGGNNDSVVYDLPLRLIHAIPQAPLCYWLPPELAEKFLSCGTINVLQADVDMGLSTKNDSRFVRVYWEVPSESIGFASTWCPYDKGGDYSPFFFPLDLVVRRENDFRQLHEELCRKFPYLKGNTGWVIHPEARYGSPGASFQMLTTKDLAPRVMPSGCAFRIAMIPDDPGIEGTMLLTGLFNSAIARVFVDALVGGGGGTLKNYEKGTVLRVPVPDLPSQLAERIANVTSSAVDAVLNGVYRFQEPSSCFLGLPMTTSIHAASELINGELERARRILLSSQKTLDVAVSDAFNLSDAASANVQSLVRQEDAPGQPVTLDEVARRYIALWVGLAFGWWEPGRWQQQHEWVQWAPDSFLPVARGLGDQQSAMLPEHSKDQLDIVRCLRDVVTRLWRGDSEALIQEACDTIGVTDLRDYLRKPTGFFQDHLRRYSKSRRKAPIYWPLSTPSGSYTIWLYYHQLTDQTLYSAVNRFVEPRLEEVQRGVGALERDVEEATGRSAAKLRDQIAEAQAFLGELSEFRDELLRVAGLPYKPNLNDGVILNAAPLYQLFRHRQWAKDTKATWRKLEKGEYDWSHMAYTIWPERAKRACMQDLSIAIAHGLEELYDGPKPGEKKKRKTRKKKTKKETAS